MVAHRAPRARRHPHRGPQAPQLRLRYLCGTIIIRNGPAGCCRTPPRSPRVVAQGDLPGAAKRSPFDLNRGRRRARGAAGLPRSRLSRTSAAPPHLCHPSATPHAPCAHHAPATTRAWRGQLPYLDPDPNPNPLPLPQPHPQPQAQSKPQPQARPDPDCDPNPNPNSSSSLNHHCVKT